MVREHPDPYLVLGVSPTATQAEITVKSWDVVYDVVV